MANHNHYHEGERRVQAKIGVADAAQRLAAAIREGIPPSAVDFIDRQAMAVFGSLDSDGQVWASVLFGAPGFLHAADSRTLRIRRHACHGAAADPLWRNLETNPHTGILLIELSTRRRLRINGKARRDADGDCLVDVRQTYANCPKYIQRRHLEISDAAGGAVEQLNRREGQRLELTQQALIRSADTFFVASAHPGQGADASHRGGHPGFVKVVNPHRLRIPDFVGNNMFNTLGNFESYPSAGLLFIDFEGGLVLQMSGRPELLLAASDEQGETGGTARFWEFEVVTWRESRLPVKLNWEFLDYSPYIPARVKSDKEMDQGSLPAKGL